MNFKIVLLVVIGLLLTSCSINEYLVEKQAKDNFDNMCNKYELTICGDITATEYTHATIVDVKYLLWNTTYISKEDTTDSYDYFNVDPIIGDCEDWVITFIEKNLRAGTFDRGEVVWMFGIKGGDYHAWAIVAKEGKLYLFDNQFRAGLLQEHAYSTYDYREMFVVYSY